MVVVMRYSRCPVKFLIWILITLFNNVAASLAASINAAISNVTVFPPYLDQLKEHTNRTVWISFSVQRQRPIGVAAFTAPDVQWNNGTSNDTKTFGFGSPLPRSPPPTNITVEFKTENPIIARVVDVQTGNPQQKGLKTFDRALVGGNGSEADSEFGEDNEEDNGNGDDWFVNTTFTVEGLFLGKTKIEIKILGVVRADNNDLEELEPVEKTPIIPGTVGIPVDAVEMSYDVWVIRHDKKLSHIFVGTLMLLLIVANVLMGAQLNMNIMFEVIKKPLAPAVGFICQFLLMPLISYSLARVMFIPDGLYNLGLGLFTTGCCPGGGASNAYTVLLDGNVDLSVTMTFLSTLLSLAMMPMWMFALGRQFLVAHPDQSISIPYRNILYSLMMLVLPLCGGVMLRRYFPKFADYAKKVLRPFLGIIIVFICTFGVYVNLYMFRLMTWRVLVGGMALPWIGFVFGFGAAAAARQAKPNIVAIAIETGIQNTGIAIMLLQLSFGQPDADLASVLPVVVAMFTPVPMVIALTIHCIMKWRTEKKKKRDVVADFCEVAFELEEL